MDTAGEEKSTFDNQFSTGTKLLHRGKVAQSLPYLERAYELGPEHVDTAINLSGAYILSKRFREAIEVLEPLSGQVTDNAMIWTNLGAAYLGNPILAGNEQQLEAINAFYEAYQLSPKAPSIAYNIGLIYRDRQEILKAIDWFERALKTNPNDNDAHRILEKLRAQSNPLDKEA
jgi:tetratricopeptide (TPR) repeat protein